MVHPSKLFRNTALYVSGVGNDFRCHKILGTREIRDLGPYFHVNMGTLTPKPTQTLDHRPAASPFTSPYFLPQFSWKTSDRVPDFI